MPIELTMPALSPTMEKGKLAKWLIKVGDRVKPGDILAEIETDKATMEFEAVDQGTISSLVIAEGTDDVRVGALLALISQSDDGRAAAEAAPADAPPSVPEPAREIAADPLPPADAPAPAIKQPQVASPVDANAGVNATPLARRIAADLNMSLLDIKGSGPGGRIVKADLATDRLVAPTPAAKSTIAAPAAMPVQAAPDPSAIMPAPTGVPVVAEKLSGMRKTIARRLTQSKQTIPHFYLTARCRLDPLLALRGEINQSLRAAGTKISVNDMFVKAMALAMIAVPDTNVQFAGDELYRFGRVDIAMAVAIDGGLITPVIADVGALSISAIAERSKTLAAKARDGKLLPEEYQGGTASISNLGMFGIDEMFPVINPPQALILGVGAGVEQPWKVDGAIGLATILAATASFDHRAIDGATAAQFMAALRDYIEHPLTLLA